MPDALFWRLNPRLLALRWACYADEQRSWDGRFGQLASIDWNANFTGERKGPADFFPSLATPDSAPNTREPQTAAEAKRMAKERWARNERTLREQWG